MNRALAIAVLLAAALLHWPGERADFSYDDIDFVVSNASIRSWPAAAGALLAPFPPEQRERGLYRPLTNASYAADFSQYGLDAVAFHRTNVVLYGAVVLAAASLYACTLPGAGLAFAAALVFAFHPVHSEAVDTIAGRSELLALLFCLLALRLFERARSASGNAARGLSLGVATLYALACLSKETAVVLPGILAARLALVGTPRFAEFRERWLLAIGPSLLVLVGYLALRIYVLGGFTPGMRVLAGESAATKVWTAGAVYAEYLRLLLWPRILQLDFYYQAAVGIVRSATEAALLGLGAASIILGLSLRGLRLHFADASSGSSSDQERDLRTAALTHTAIALAFFFPVSHVIEIGALMAERFLFAPSLGLCALVCIGAQWLARRAPAGRERFASALLCALLALFVVGSARRSVDRAAEWRDGVALWASAARLLPGDARVHSNLGKQQLGRELFGAAEASFQRALALEPGQPAALLNLGVLRERQGRQSEARVTYQRLVEAWPNDFVAWNNLGVVEMRGGLARAALRSFERSLALNPNHAAAIENLERARAEIARIERFFERERSRAEGANDADLARALARACRALERGCDPHFDRLARRIESER